MFCYDGLPFALRLAMFLLAAAVAVWLVRSDAAAIRRSKRWLTRLARRPWISMAAVVLTCLFVNAGLAVVQYPQPKVHDEFAYRLAADTYASGRLTNPTHPHWKHFETFHVLSQPSYMAKYPPGNGLFLALGQMLTGHSIVGSWIAMAMALACLYWMSQAWIPGRWALFGSLLLAINAPMLMAWGQTWWGGGLAMAGGALLFGSMKRIVEPAKWKQPTWQYAILFSIGAVLLALTRPLEGLLACLAAGAVILVWLWKRRDDPSQPRLMKLTQLAIPAILIGGSGVAFLLINNQAVTGSARTMPYVEHSKQYSATSMWVWRELPPRKEYNLARMESLYVNWSRARQESAQSVSGFLTLAKKKLNLLWRFFPLAGGLCLAPIPFLINKQRFWLSFCLAVIGGMLLMQLQLINSYTFPHYIAPIAGLFYVLLFFGLRCWSIISRKWAPARIVVPTMAIYAVLCLIALFGWTHLRATPTPRVMAETRLQSQAGEHLVFVKYPIGHNLHEEWVYNRADIDNARIVWANHLSMSENRRLIDYFSQRRVWVWDVASGDLKPVAIEQTAGR